MLQSQRSPTHVPPRPLIKSRESLECRIHNKSVKNIRETNYDTNPHPSPTLHTQQICGKHCTDTFQFGIQYVLIYEQSTSRNPTLLLRKQTQQSYFVQRHTLIIIIKLQQQKVHIHDDASLFLFRIRSLVWLARTAALEDGISARKMLLQGICGRIFYNNVGCARVQAMRFRSDSRVCPKPAAHQTCLKSNDSSGGVIILPVRACQRRLV